VREQLRALVYRVKKCRTLVERATLSVTYSYTVLDPGSIIRVLMVGCSSMLNPGGNFLWKKRGRGSWIFCSQVVLDV